MEAVIFAAVLVAVASWVAAPLYRPRGGRGPGGAHGTDWGAQARREAAEDTLRELHVDLETGMLDPEDYRRAQAALADTAGETPRHPPSDGPRSDGQL